MEEQRVATHVAWHRRHPYGAQSYVSNTTRDESVELSQNLQIGQERACSDHTGRDDSGAQISDRFQNLSASLRGPQALLLPHQRITREHALRRLWRSLKGTVLCDRLLQSLRKHCKQMSDWTKKLCCMAAVHDVGLRFPFPPHRRSQALLDHSAIQTPSMALHLQQYVLARHRPGSLTHAVYLRLHDLEATDQLVEAFQHELERFLRLRGISVRWRVGSPVPAETLELIVHQTEQRLDAKALVLALQRLAGEHDGLLAKPVLALLLPHNPAMAAAPPDSRSMTDDYSYEKLEGLSLSGECLDCYFWSSGMADPRLRSMNEAAFESIYTQVRTRAGSPRRTSYVVNASGQAVNTSTPFIGGRNGHVTL